MGKMRPPFFSFITGTQAFKRRDASVEDMGRWCGAWVTQSVKSVNRSHELRSFSVSFFFFSPFHLFCSATLFGSFLSLQFSFVFIFFTLLPAGKSTFAGKLTGSWLLEDGGYRIANGEWNGGRSFLLFYFHLFFSFLKRVVFSLARFSPSIAR